MENSGLKIIVKFDFKLSLWQAVKLRIGGSNVKRIVDEIIKTIKSNVECGGSVEHGNLQDGSKIVEK
jgi:hypothetical protein